jgi:hypothetical protein
MAARVSAYDRQARLATPDGSVTASYDGTEFSQGTTPTHGAWRLSTGLVLEGCGASGVFSEDGVWFAAPRWIVEYAYNKEAKQLLNAAFGHQIVVAHLPTQAVYTLDRRYGVIELESFRGGVITGEEEPGSGRRLTVRVAAA